MALEALGEALPQAVVAAEDARFCAHWGFDIDEIRRAVAGGAARGASTITQQTVKNVYLWPGRSWLRKGLEAALTPLVEAVWGKRRILEVYLNVAEFGPGLFGAEAAARRWFGKSAAALTAREAALLAAILPAPRTRDPTRPTAFLTRRAASIRRSVETLDATGGYACLSATASR
jgi:monofunctional biosynthetic peptidoglycan transglycosylase